MPNAAAHRRIPLALNAASIDARDGLSMTLILGALISVSPIRTAHSPECGTKGVMPY